MEINNVNGSAVVQYAYDALGRRIEKKDLVTSANTRRYYHGGRCWWNAMVPVVGGERRGK